MAAMKKLSSLKASQLKTVATSIGLASAGTKSELEALIRQRVKDGNHLSRSPRIVSVDMGIKNLGLCVLGASQPQPSQTSPNLSSSPAIKVLQWQRVDVLQQLLQSSHTPSGRAYPKPGLKAKIDPSIFRPSTLSRTAHTIATDLITRFSPTHILIERQRFRSGGASAVQEWTLRVNMLEAMLWACFESMRHHHDVTASKGGAGFPEVLEVSPSRVARFWCGGSAGQSTILTSALFDEASVKGIEVQAKAARKIDKKDKINVVRSWLTAKDGEEVDVRLELSEQAQSTAKAFTKDGTARGRRSEKAVGTSDAKLDDLADCLLQGVAWVRWEENRRRLDEIIDISKTE